MIIKGCSRAAPMQLAKHLLRADTNEHVHILELQSPTNNLTEAFRDWQCLADGTRGTKGLYHANIDPEARYEMTPEQWHRSVEVLERSLGMQGQPRAVVLHEKKGRQHIHVVWQRTDIDTMTLRSDSWNYRAHEEASLTLEREFGHDHVPGKHAKRGIENDRTPEPPSAAVNHAEWQQAERTGLDPKERKQETTALFSTCDNGHAFKAGLEDAGYMLAKGDQRDFVIVDTAGDVHSLARQIKGVTTKDLRAFMADVDSQSLPTVEEAKAQQTSPANVNAPNSDAASDKNVAAAEMPAAATESALDHRLRELRQAQDLEKARVIRVLDEEKAQQQATFDRVQTEERAQFENARQSDQSGLLNAVKKVLLPKQVAEEDRRRDEAAKEFEEQQQNERREFSDALQRKRDTVVDDIQARHELQYKNLSEQLSREATLQRQGEAGQQELERIVEERRSKFLEGLARDGPEDERKRAR